MIRLDGIKTAPILWFFMVTHFRLMTIHLCQCGIYRINISYGLGLCVYLVRDGLVGLRFGWNVHNPWDEFFKEDQILIFD